VPQILDGNRVRDQIKAECLPRVERLVSHAGRPPGLAVVLVGNNPASEVYVRNKTKTASDLGMHSETITPSAEMTTDQLLDLGKGDVLLILAYGRLYREVKALFAEARALRLPTVLVTEADDTPLAKLADVCVAIPRGRPGQMALHGATLVGLEALVLSLAAAKPEAALSSLDNLNRLRRATEAQSKSAK